MLVAPKTLDKLRQIESIYQERIYEPVLALECCYFETDAHLRAVPGSEAPWRPCPPGLSWGKAWGSAWFVAEARIPEFLAGRPVYLCARTGAVEALFWLDGKPSGLFNFDPFVRSRGDHRAQLICEAADPDRVYRLAVEGYAGHPTPGSQPMERPETQDIYPPTFVRRFDRMELCTRNEAVNDFVLDLRALNQLSVALPAESFRKGSVDAALARVFEVVVRSPEDAPRETWLASLAAAREIIRPLLACHNGDSAPFAGLIGHSHLDSAWHWTLDEAIRKCARTSSNALGLMSRYPEYRYIQSSALHLEWMRRHYPAIFAGIGERIREGRWEPNSGVWVEPDVNLVGGEALVRQFLWGQRYTQAHFAYRSDTFWLPDSFGYSAALPQIMLGCGVSFFLTTKLTWNESNPFPYDTFWWEGIDGSRVFTHFNDIHCAPDPATLINKLHGSGPKDFRVVENCVRHKDVNDRRLISYGFGDGGGGPDPQMIEIARRCVDLEGCPRAGHVSVSGFMGELRGRTPGAPVFRGELYVEGHRGTLTQMHEIKRRNRKAELALREAEFLLARGGAKRRRDSREALNALWETLLVNQFHDILPGTSIAEVHDRAIRELGEVIAGAERLGREAVEVIRDAGDKASVTMINSLSWTRNTAVLALNSERVPQGPGITTQMVTTPWGDRRVVVEGLELPPLGTRTLACAKAVAHETPGPFAWDGECLQSPCVRVRFDPSGGLASVVDVASGRELRSPGGLALNTFLFGEDVPAAWDNWDIDADLDCKLKPVLRLESREVAARGPLQFRVRQRFAFGQSSLLQDVVFHAGSARIDFETMIEWSEKHRFLATLFPLNLCVPGARHEIQFGHLERTTHRNFSEDRARFEVSQHKWTDLSENRFGVALLNDCKYGVSVRGSDLRLSLHKGGCHPDPRGDAGRHVCSYALVPHEGGFRAETVVRPAYELNVEPTVIGGGLGGNAGSLLVVDAPNVVVETVKPAEEGEGIVIRLYECERSACRARLTFPASVQKVFETNLLEETPREQLIEAGAVELAFRPFEIKTLLLVNAPFPSA